MIYTVTLNPTIDCTMWLDNFEKGKTNRSVRECISVGGKGINVSLVLKELGFSSVATGFVAGFTGEAVVNTLEEAGVQTDFVRLPCGNTRINMQLKEKDETEINGLGPEVGDEFGHELIKKLEVLSKGDVLVLAGSLPRGLDGEFYGNILKKLQGRGVLSVVDTTGQKLVNALKYNPFLIKPNLAELEEIVGTKLGSVEEVFASAEKLREMGAKNVIVSMGGDGAVLLDSTGERHIMGTIPGKLVNSVGAGDSLVAGFIAGLLETGDYTKALHIGCCAGAATAFSEGLAKKEDIEKLLNI